ncbi:MAG: type II 3-dehydroquinate dehydratase [Alphaproteobacteria bacterium]
MTQTILVLNGPNLNMLGIREPDIYGHTTLADIEAMCHAHAAKIGVAVDFRQTNSETQLVDWLHEATKAKTAGVIINPAGHSFGSIPVLDALKIYRWPIVELHISNIHTREPLYQHSIMSSAATAVMAGFGAHGYVLALDAIVEMLRQGDPKN